MEVFVPFHFQTGDAPVATAVKSTLLVSAVQTLRAHQLFDAYFEKLPPKSQQDMNSLIAGTWASMSLALDHYKAVDALKLTNETIEAIGGEVSDRINRSVLLTLVRATKQVGASPWTFLGQAHRLRELTWNGSDMCVQKLGPKEARLEWVGQPLAQTGYFVTSFGGYLQAAAGLFCARAYTKDQSAFVTRANRIIYRISWA